MPSTGPDVPASSRGYAWHAMRGLIEDGDAEALVSGERRFTRDGVRRRVAGMATVLWQHGVRPGQTVGTLAVNPPESIFLQLALHLMGCRSAWVAPSAPAPFRQEFLRLAAVDAFVYEQANVPTIGPQLADASPATTVFCFGTGGRGPDLSVDAPPEDLPFEPATVEGGLGSLFQTGGTTGVPKLIHHGSPYFEQLYQMSTEYGRAGHPRLRHLLTSGTWHASAQVAAYMTLFSGGTLFLQEGLDIERFLVTIETERINSTLVMPAQLYQLLDDSRLATIDTSSLQTLSVSGAPVAPTRLAAAVERFGPVIRVVYGMSEYPMIAAFPNVAVDPERPGLLASCGTPYGDTRIEIRDGDGASRPPGETGEICVSGTLMMSGYFGAPELTAQTVVDGWLRTGDVGRLDADGRLYIVDRAKDMIITGVGAVNVYSRMVEDVLLTHPQLRYAAVIGLPDASVGELVHAFVVAAPGSGLAAQDVRAHALTELNNIWAPRHVHFLDELPLTPSGKVDKKRLRAEYLSTVASTMDGNGSRAATASTVGGPV